MRGLIIGQVIGGLILLGVFIVACISERITTQPFDIATILGLILSMVTRPSFWIGLAIEEYCRIKKKRLKRKVN